eukprot:TRINITY_DN9542_c0_g1_i1.p1 TRINITY_DN9542_c0_g1~~TRINITY_DN9542_c0_g1_i1.p1  ORF type:complete len:134 (-),score=22.10 TRINITY_DN9542_c0_g1_i1:213-614(-)
MPLSDGSDMTFNMWDTAGQEKFGGLRDGYYIMSNAGIIFFDVSARITYKNTPTWYRDLVRVCENIPIVLVGAKCDVAERRVKSKQVMFHRKRNIPYVELSSKTCINIWLPLQLIAQALRKDSSLRWTPQSDTK